MQKWELEWHSKRTGQEGVDYEEADTPEEARSLYEGRYPMREVKAIGAMPDNFADGLDG